jgi:F0F1-type ATP synthase membrane subunit c/vacuolar-type H+-ATPase subunit K
MIFLNMTAHLDSYDPSAPRKQQMSYLLAALCLGLTASTVVGAPLNVIIAADMNAAGRKAQLTGHIFPE